MIKKYTCYLYKPAVFLFVFLTLLEITGYLFGGGKPSDYFYFWTVYESDKIYFENKYPIKIEFHVNKNNYPDGWLKDISEENNFTTINDGYKRTEILRLIPNEIEKYSVSVIKENLNKLYFLGVLSPNGNEIGGTYDESRNALFLATASKNNRGYSDDFVKRAFHHELSSILMDHYHFSENKWRSAAGEGFQYEQDKDPTYRWMYLNNYIKRIDDEIFWKRGILRQYGETGLENDFNTYAENIFVNPIKMKRLISEYPIIKRKYEVFKQFYLSIDQGFAPVFEKIDV